MINSSPREHCDAKRFEIYSDLKAHWDGTKLKHGIKGIIAKKHHVARTTVDYCWKPGNEVSDPQEAWKTLKSKKKKAGWS